MDKTKYNNIPQELKELKQWVCAREDKVPFNPVTGNAASPTKSSDWASFNDCIAKDPHYIGFVLTKDDPYVVLDLDNKEHDPASEAELERYQQMVEQFDSYTEVSASGRGLHVVCKGETVRGVRRDKVELYSDQRYIVFTGNTLMPMKPIADRAQLVDNLFNEMSQDPKSQTIELVQVASDLEDTEVLTMAHEASNGEKFDKLYTGDWQDDYESQSEADLAMITILAFYSNDNAQVRRLFRMTQLGKREKAQRDSYIDYALKKVRAYQGSVADVELNIDRLIESNSTKEVVEELRHAPRKVKEAELDFPPGFLGNLAMYFYDSAAKPMREASIIAALGLTAGVLGRSYTVSNYGLNLYLMLLAHTGAGKDVINSGPAAMLNSVRMTVPGVDTFRLPNYASGQAMVKHLAEAKCGVAIEGEFGLKLQQICDPKANSALTTLKQNMLQLYSLSGPSGYMTSMSYSNKENNSAGVQSPCLTIMGEGTQSTFFKNLTDEHIADGLIPRFLVLESTSDTPYLNENMGGEPSEHLKDKFEEFCLIGMRNLQDDGRTIVEFSQDAKRMLTNLDIEVTNTINASKDEGIASHLWNRAVPNANRIAALIAVSRHPYNPCIERADVEWAIKFVKRCIGTMLRQSNVGELAALDVQRHVKIKGLVVKWGKMPTSKRRNYNCPKSLTQIEGIVPVGYIKQQVRGVKLFSEHRLGPSAAVDMVLDEMAESGLLEVMTKGHCLKKYGCSTTLIVPTNEFDQ